MAEWCFRGDSKDRHGHVCRESASHVSVARFCASLVHATLTQQSWSTSGQMLMSTWMYLSFDSGSVPVALPFPDASAGIMTCSPMSEGHGIARFADDPRTMAYLARRVRCTTAINSCGVLGTESSWPFGNTTRLSRATRMSMSPKSFFPGPSIGVATQTKSSRSAAWHSERTRWYTVGGIRGVQGGSGSEEKAEPPITMVMLCQCLLTVGDDVREGHRKKERSGRERQSRPASRWREVETQERRGFIGKRKSFRSV